MPAEAPVIRSEGTTWSRRYAPRRVNARPTLPRWARARVHRPSVHAPEVTNVHLLRRRLLRLLGDRLHVELGGAHLEQDAGRAGRAAAHVLDAAGDDEIRARPELLLRAALGCHRERAGDHHGGGVARVRVKRVHLARRDLREGRVRALHRVALHVGDLSAARRIRRRARRTGTSTHFRSSGDIITISFFAAHAAPIAPIVRTPAMNQPM